VTEFDFEGVFDEDYLYFYEEMLTERTPEELKRIVELRGSTTRSSPGAASCSRPRTSRESCSTPSRCTSSASVTAT